MKRILTILGVLATILIVAMTFLVSGPQLAGPINWFLPQGWKVHIAQGLTLSLENAKLPHFQLNYQNCPLIIADSPTLTWVEKPHLSAKTVNINYHCLSLISPKENSETSPSLTSLLSLIPDGEITIQTLNWEHLPHELSQRTKALLTQPATLAILKSNRGITASLHQQAVRFNANFANNTLNANLRYQPEDKEQHQITLSAQIEDDFISFPSSLSAEYEWRLPQEIVGEPTLQKGRSTLTWQQNADKQLVGNWSASLIDSPNDKFDFPFLFDGKRLEIKQGRFDWNLTKSFPFHGFISVTLTPENLKNQILPLKTAVRISLLSENAWGKGNIVISNVEGEIRENGLNLPLRLTGNIKHGNFILYSSIPLDIQGHYDDVTLKFLPGSLLRLTGKERYLTIEDLRFPLAGIRVDKYGIHGRLQAILKGESPDFKDINFHLDGYANNFKVGALNTFQDPLDANAIKDSWKWRIWGHSTLKALNSKINLSGRGQWHQHNVTLTELFGDLSEVKLNSTTIAKTELNLNKIIQFNTQTFILEGEVGLKSPEIKFAYGGQLPKPRAKLAFNNNIENLNFKGSIHTNELGPLKLFARRQLTADASQIIGKLYWHEQPAHAIQALFPFRSQWIIKNGTIKGETAFSASVKDGLIAGGHLTIRNGSLSLPSGEAKGIEFALPYRYQNGLFHFGVKKPIDVKIAQIKLGDLALDNASMKINGYYPYSKTKPLNLNELSFDLFGGKLNIKRFALPQTELAYLNLERMDFEKILQFIQYQQIDLKGKANATLPFWLNGKPCYICDGQLTQTETSYLTFTPELLNAMAKSGYTEQILLHLVDKSTIREFHSQINVGSKGDLVLDSKLKLESNQGKSKVNLNYNHRENMFDLWKLINYSSQFEQKLENYLYQKLEK